MNGPDLYATGGHRFLVKSDPHGPTYYKELALIRPNEYLVLADGTPITRPPIEEVPGLHDVYNFEVEGHHNYIAGGFRVHNDSIEIVGTVGSAIGGLIASQLWQRFGTGDPVAGLAVNIGGSVVGRFVNLAAHDAFSIEANAGLNSFIDNFGGNLVGALSGAVGGFLGGELADLVAPNEPIVRILFSTGGSLAAQQLAHLVVPNLLPAVSGISVGTAFGGAVGSYLGTLASKGLIQGSPENAAIGNAIGSTIASVASTVFAASLPIGPLAWIPAAIFALIAHFAGSFLGNVIGGLFGHPSVGPNGSALVGLDATTGHYGIVAYGVDNGLDPAVILEVGNAATAIVNDTLDLIGGFAYWSGSNVSYGYGPASQNVQWWFSHNGSAPQNQGSNATTLLRLGTRWQLQNQQIEGGDVYMKRAIASTLGDGTVWYLDNDATYTGQIRERLETAHQYGLYQDNPQAFESLLDVLDPKAIRDWETARTKALNWNLDDPNAGKATSVTFGSALEDWTALTPAQLTAKLDAIRQPVPLAGRRYVETDLAPALAPSERTARIVALDLDGDGIEVSPLRLAALATSPASGGGDVRFDIDGDGYAEATSWIGAEDGMLVVDRNGDGRITEFSELFTSIVGAGPMALASFDSNGDGLVDQSDRNWDDLRIWVDANQDGVSDFGEVFALSRFGIRAFGVAETAASATIAGGRVVWQGRYLQYGIRTGALGGATGDDRHLGGIYGVELIHDDAGIGAIKNSNAGLIGSFDFEGRGAFTYAGDTAVTLTVDATVTASVQGGLGNDTFTVGNAGYPVKGVMLNGGDGDDVLTGGKGDDTLVGGKGVDRLSGGLGDDVVAADYADLSAASPVVTGGDGFDILVHDGDYKDAQGATVTRTFNLAPGAFEAFVGGDGADDVTGGSADEVIGGEAGDDILKGLGGADTLEGAAGKDHLQGGDGNDVLIGGTGKDKLEGGTGDDTLVADMADLTALAGPPAEAVLVDGGAGSDTLMLDGGEAFTIDAAAYNVEIVVGGFGNDTLKTTGAGAVQLFGEFGDDILSGNAGADSFDGGPGFDTVTYAASTAAAVVIDLSVTPGIAHPFGSGDSDVRWRRREAQVLRAVATPRARGRGEGDSRCASLT